MATGRLWRPHDGTRRRGWSSKTHLARMDQSTLNVRTHHMARILMTIAVAIAHLAVWICPAYAQSPEKSVVLFLDVKIFDGKADSLSEGMHVLVEGNKIAKISKTPIQAPGATVADAKGRTLMPGLIDVHVHTVLESMTLSDVLNADIGYVHIAAAHAA